MTTSSKKRRIRTNNLPKIKPAPPEEIIPKVVLPARPESLLSIASEGKQMPESIDISKMSDETLFNFLTDPFQFDPGSVVPEGTPMPEQKKD